MSKTRWVDISVTIKSGMVHWPGDPQVRIKLIQDMDRGDVDNLSLVSMGSHTGTHVDAPFHFVSDGTSIDKMPLDVVVGLARVIEIQDSECIRESELRTYRIRRGERVLFKTRNSTYWRTDAFKRKFVYMPLETAKYLVERGVRTVGVDYLSVGGFYKDSVQTHQELLKAGVWIVEGLDLSRVTPGKYDLICLPLKLLHSDGAPARAIVRRRA